MHFFRKEGFKHNLVLDHLSECKTLQLGEVGQLHHILNLKSSFFWLYHNLGLLFFTKAINRPYFLV